MPGTTQTKSAWIGWFLRGPQAAPPDYQQKLWLVWRIWVAVTMALCGPCKKYADFKKTTDRAIFRYL